MKKSNRLTVLPIKLIDDLNQLGLSKIQFNKSIELLAILKQKSLNKNGSGNIFGEIGISSTYFREVFSTKYTDFLKPLIDSGIIVQGKSYSVEKGVAKKYSINNKYENFQKINKELSYLFREYYNDNSGSSNISSISSCYYLFQTDLLQPTDSNSYKDFKISKNSENMMINYTVKTDLKTEKKDNFYLANFKKDFKTLKIDLSKLTRVTVERLSKLNINDFATNEQITSPVVNVKINGKWVYINTDKAIALAKKANKSLIQDKSTYHIENEVEFITRKINNIYNSYSEAMGKLDRQYYYANRNTTNNRLDTNITSLCSGFMDVIKEDNDLVELDMSNSQFAILSYIMPDLNTDDYRRFKALSFSGELYTYLQTELGLESRLDAKNLTFQILFGKANQKTEQMNQITKLFPSVIGWINNYKKEFGYKNFSIMLQQEEAKIFVDEIYTEIKKKGLFCLTKHDSLMIRREDKEVVSNFIEEYFDSIGFEGSLR